MQAIFTSPILNVVLIDADYYSSLGHKMQRIKTHSHKLFFIKWLFKVVLQKILHLNVKYIIDSGQFFSYDFFVEERKL